MLLRNKKWAALCVVFLLLGCTQGQNIPLVFAQTESVGITINTGATQTSPELTLGYRDVDAAVIPVTYSPSSGSVSPLLGKIWTSGGENDDALSVLGQFSVSAQASGACVGLGKFFATGLAAKKLTDGFATDLATKTSASTSSAGGAACSTQATNVAPAVAPAIVAPAAPLAPAAPVAPPLAPAPPAAPAVPPAAVAH